MMTLFFSIVVYLLACKLFANNKKQQQMHVPQRAKTVAVTPRTSSWNQSPNHYHRKTTMTSERRKDDS